MSDRLRCRRPMVIDSLPNAVDALDQIEQRLVRNSIRPAAISWIGPYWLAVAGIGGAAVGEAACTASCGWVILKAGWRVLYAQVSRLCCSFQPGAVAAARLCQGGWRNGQHSRRSVLASNRHPSQRPARPRGHRN